MHYDSHINLSVKGRSFHHKILVMFTNLLTLWQCEQCCTKYPHHPLKGTRLNYFNHGICKSCEGMNNIERDFKKKSDEIRLNHEIEMSRIKREHKEVMEN